MRAAPRRGVWRRSIMALHLGAAGAGQLGAAGNSRISHVRVTVLVFGTPGRFVIVLNVIVTVTVYTFRLLTVDELEVTFGVVPRFGDAAWAASVTLVYRDS